MLRVFYKFSVLKYCCIDHSKKLFAWPKNKDGENVTNKANFNDVNENITAVTVFLPSNKTPGF